MKTKSTVMPGKMKPMGEKSGPAKAKSAAMPGKMKPAGEKAMMMKKGAKRGY